MDTLTTGGFQLMSQQGLDLAGRFTGSFIGTALAGAAGALITLVIQGVTASVNRRRQEKYAAELAYYDLRHAQNTIERQEVARQKYLQGRGGAGPERQSSSREDESEVPYVRPHLADPSLWRTYRPMLRRRLRAREAADLDSFYLVVEEFNKVTEIEYFLRLRCAEEVQVMVPVRLDLIMRLSAHMPAIEPIAAKLGRVARVSSI